MTKAAFSDAAHGRDRSCTLQQKRVGEGRLFSTTKKKILSGNSSAILIKLCYLNQCNASQRHKLLFFATKKGSVKDSFLIQQFAKQDVHWEYIHNIDQAALRKDEFCCQSLLRPPS